MKKVVRSARGTLVDFELLAIKNQLASAPAPATVEDRKKQIDEVNAGRSKAEETPSDEGTV
jgi:hypothetical protein